MNDCLAFSCNFGLFYSNATDPAEFLNCEKIGSTEYYWYHEALQISENISDTSGFAWKITMCLLLAWVLVALCMWKGIQTTGKVNRSKPERKVLETYICEDFS